MQLNVIQHQLRRTMTVEKCLQCTMFIHVATRANADTFRLACMKANQYVFDVEALTTYKQAAQYQ